MTIYVPVSINQDQPIFWLFNSLIQILKIQK